MGSVVEEVERRVEPPIGRPGTSTGRTERSPRVQLTRAVLVALATLAGSLLLQLVVVGDLQQRATQQRLFDSLRADLATGTAPIGPTDPGGRILAGGTPIAYLEIPAIGLRQVVVEGTTSGTLLDGPGHRRDTPFPGQAGTSVLLARRAAFGGPFARLADLERGEVIRVTTGQGAFEFSVLGVRNEGDPVPEPVGSGEGRLVLATAGGRAFVPSGVVRVDADLEGSAVAGRRPLVSPGLLPGAEQAMGTDSSSLWALALWLQLLLAVAGAGVWSWQRMGRARTWLVFAPPAVLVGLSAAGEVARLLPNLL